MGALRNIECLIAAATFAAVACSGRSVRHDAAPPGASAGAGGSAGAAGDDECESVDDCAVATDTTNCCACPVAVPKTLLAASECLVAPGTATPSSCNSCGDVNCEPCVTPGLLTCLPLADGHKHCVLAPKLDLGPDQCAAEQGCADNPSYGCTVCLAPSEKACGGPPPLPADCTSDAECQASADNLICDALPCELAHCIQGCIADTDCHSWEYCGSDHRCAPSGCASNEACGTDSVCVRGRCEPRPCVTSADCDGYCVKGRCFASPGSCADGCVP